MMASPVLKGHPDVIHHHIVDGKGLGDEVTQSLAENSEQKNSSSRNPGSNSDTRSNDITLRHETSQ